MDNKRKKMKLEKTKTKQRFSASSIKQLIKTQLKTVVAYTSNPFYLFKNIVYTQNPSTTH